jgi:hypothetical protein
MTNLESSHAELRAALILAGCEIRRLNFGRRDSKILRRVQQLQLKGPVWYAMSRAATLSLDRMRMRNMIVAGCVPVIVGATRSLQDPTVLRRSPAGAFVRRRPTLVLQASQFRDALFHVTDMGIQGATEQSASVPNLAGTTYREGNETVKIRLTGLDTNRH